MYNILDGLRIVELSAFVAAPLGGLTLSQLGADVVRIDHPDGGLDYKRWPLSENGRSLYWHGLNKGKRSVAIDISHPEGRALAADLIAAPDGDGILLTNFPARGWLAYQALKARRPDLIMLNIVGNPDGSTALDYTINCAVGIPFATGDAVPDHPVNHMFPAWDAITGTLAAAGLLAAERRRHRTGEGQYIKLSLADVALATIGHLGHIAEAQILGRNRSAIGNYLYGAFARDFATRDDRRIMIVAITQKQWSTLLAATGLGPTMERIAEELGLDLSNEGGRFEARETIAGVLAPWCRLRTLTEIRSIFDKHVVCWGPYQTFTQLVREDPRCSIANPLFETVEQPGIGAYLMPGSPLTFGSIPREPVRPAPQLGEHTHAVLAEQLKMPAREFERLLQAGIIAQHGQSAADLQSLRVPA